MVCLALVVLRVAGGAGAADLGLFVPGLIVPMLLIWFPEPIGSYTGFAGARPPITQATPAPIVSFVGWVILLSALWYRPLIHLLSGY